MFRNQLVGRLMFWRQQRRNITTTRPKRGGDHHDEGGVPGATLPFDTSNRYLLALTVGTFFGSAFATPFLLLRHQLKKKSA
ncbi:Cytochrome c oxidase subunit 7C, mitochondrial [Orchesella cincta]|uniref:Cytochrome c oxidase subunit 7C, mitochondrial n=1 Tax=Orchesella cincta TaxID=48709 RepID=A0A1D2NAL4_ORCCI|nr:Cytochrome c oxidase subunit 7C, mitochondrial [Orchesella cincta]